MATEDREFSHNHAESSEDMAEMLFPRKRCCFCIPCFGSTRSAAVGRTWWQKVRMAENEEGWLSRGIAALMKVREWSEIVAGPRWKTFIRRFNRNKSGGSKHANFQYDPLSYALNFDDGSAQIADLEDEHGFPNFSSRYAAIPMTAKSSMDFGEDAPAFT
ncbi:hypothetical protein CsSME_00006906 [Camellia sinensis var. sinensis]